MHVALYKWTTITVTKITNWDFNSQNYLDTRVRVVYAVAKTDAFTDIVHKVIFKNLIVFETTDQ